MRPATVVRWIAVAWAAVWAAAIALPSERIRRARRGLLPRQAHQSLCVVDGGRRLRPVCAAAREAHRPPHPGRADHGGAEHGRRRRHPRRQPPLRGRRTGRHRDRRALAQHRHRATVPARYPVRRAPLPVDRLAAAGDRAVHHLDAQGIALARRPEEARSDRELDRAQCADLGLSAHVECALRHEDQAGRRLSGLAGSADRVRARRGRGLCVGRHQRRNARADAAVDQGRHRQSRVADGHEARREFSGRADGDRRDDDGGSQADVRDRCSPTR